MSPRIAGTTLIGFATLFVAAPSGAQQGPVEVAFELPLNLTRLPSQVGKVQVDCELSSIAIIETPAYQSARPHRRNATMDIPVLQGEVVQSVRLVITLAPQELDDPSGKQASYECKLRGFQQSSQAWLPFNTGNTPGFVLTPAPVLITGTFVW